MPKQQAENHEDNVVREADSKAQDHRLHRLPQILFDAVGHLSPELSEEACNTLCDDARSLELNSLTLNFRNNGEHSLALACVLLPLKASCLKRAFTHSLLQALKQSFSSMWQSEGALSSYLFSALMYPFICSVWRANMPTLESRCQLSSRA